MGTRHAFGSHTYMESKHSCVHTDIYIYIYTFKRNQFKLFEILCFIFEEDCSGEVRPRRIQGCTTQFESSISTFNDKTKYDSIF